MTQTTTTPTQQKKDVTQQRFACDGGNAGLGHPRVFLTIGAEGTVECPYCDCLYTYHETK